VSTPPADDGLPERLRAQAFIREGEQAVGRSWFRALTRWLDRVRPSVVRRDGPGGPRIDPARVSDHTGFWTEQVDVEVMPTITGVLTNAWNRVLPSRAPGSDTWVSEYLNEVGNRLVRLPDEIYGLIVMEVERGVSEGRSVQDVAREIDALLTSTGSERWPARAITVARTETIGAVNAGIFRSAVLDAQERGDPAPFKAWLATDDSRTRPTHHAADGQRTLMSEPFVVGTARLMFPGDPRGPAGEVINCRCSLLPFILGERIDWTDRQNP
jgi:hypothetical protein